MSGLWWFVMGWLASWVFSIVTLVAMVAWDSWKAKREARREWTRRVTRMEGYQWRD